jgi:para-aminobenzoate synthetase / 4-amino-4-deoxychorismate lyase
LSKIRLLLSKSGAITIEIRPLTDKAEPWTVAVVPLPVESTDFRLHHKTSDRAFYDEARIASVADEVLFVDRDGFLTEGSITAIFVERDGKLLTPALSRGALPSVLRQELIEIGQALEADLNATDLTGNFFVGNSVRGLIPAKRVA